MEHPLIAAIRGRYNEDGSITQKLEINPRGVSNDNMVVEMDKRKISSECVENGVIIDDTQGFDGVRIYKEYSPTIRAARSGLKTMEKDLYEGKWRIRKLTSLECFRLMAFEDEDWEKAAEVNSNSALYKQAGNSIVVSVLEGIFSQIFKDRMPQTT